MSSPYEDRNAWRLSVDTVNSMGKEAREHPDATWPARAVADLCCEIALLQADKGELRAEVERLRAELRR